MNPERAQRSLDARIAALAAQQHGLVTGEQLARLGLSAAGVQSRVRAGRLHRRHRGVYAVGHPVIAGSGLRLAAVLASGPGAALSHAAGADHWAIRRSAASLVDVTVPTRSGRRSRPGIRVHRMALCPFEVTRRDGVPVTIVARTLVDLAEVVRREALERALDEAERLRLLDLAELDAVAAAHPHRHGVARVRRVLAEYEVGEHLTRSDLERRVLAICRQAGVPPPLVNAWVAGLEVDFFWPHAALVAEADSRRHHATRHAFERDRERDAHLLAHGIRVLRLTRRRITRHPAQVGETLRALTT